jgi:hypothetical protein
VRMPILINPRRERGRHPYGNMYKVIHVAVVSHE